MRQVKLIVEKLGERLGALHNTCSNIDDFHRDADSEGVRWCSDSCSAFCLPLLLPHLDSDIVTNTQPVLLSRAYYHSLRACPTGTPKGVFIV